MSTNELRGGEIAVVIDDKPCLARRGDSLLTVARDNGINIPTLCDLKKLSPTGACRMCVVEEEGGNVIASCKSFVERPTRIYTNTPKLQRYRNQIMSFLCINHPLECGVCDKSGECELQDKVLESKVEIQPFFAVQKQNDFVHFHNKIYNESLCIMCERCARTCNEFVGNKVLSVLSAGFHSKIGVDFKAYCEDCDECVSVCPTGAMFSSRFTYSSNAWELEKNESFCLHCSLHCELDYEVKHNIDSKKEVYRIKNKAHINQLCHAGRHNFLRKNPLSPSFLGANLSPALLSPLAAPLDTRLASPAFGLTAPKNPLSSSFSLEAALERVEAIRLSTAVTNEEAYLASLLATKAGKRLYCNEALRYAEFMEILRGYSLDEAAFDEASSALIAKVRRDSKPSSVVLVLGSYLFDELPVLRSDLSKRGLKVGAKTVWLSPIAEDRFQSDLSLEYEVGTECGVALVLLSIFRDRLAMLCGEAIENLEVSEAAKDSIKARKIANLKSIEALLAWLDDLDLANIMAETNLNESEVERLRELCLYEAPLEASDGAPGALRAELSILVGQDFYLSPHARLLARILGAIGVATGYGVLALPYDNILGIQALCKLDEDDGRFDSVLGLRCNAAYYLAPKPYPPLSPLAPTLADKDSMLTRHCPLLPLQFMEGTVVDIEGRLTKLAPSFVDEGFGGLGDSSPQTLAYGNPNLDLLDLCRDYLDLPFEYLVELTSELPLGASRLGLAFDSLESKTALPPSSLQAARSYVEGKIALVGPSLEGGSGVSIYRAALSGNLSFYRNDYCNLDLEGGDKLGGILRVSTQFCKATGLKDAGIVDLILGHFSLKVRVEELAYLRGMVAVLASDALVDSAKYFDYKRAGLGDENNN